MLFGELFARVCPRDARLLSGRNALYRIQGFSNEGGLIVDLELRFFQKMSGLRDKERNTKVLDVEWGGRIEPVTWHVIRIEVLGGTELSKQMLQKLADRELI